MAGSRKPGSTGRENGGCILPARTPGTLGINDQSDPNVHAWQGNTPGPTGIGDFARPKFRAAAGPPGTSLVSPVNENDLGNRASSAPIVGTG